MGKISKLIIACSIMLISIILTLINFNSISLDGIYRLTEMTLINKLASIFIISYVLIKVYFELASEKKYDMKGLQVTLLIVTSSLMLIYNVISYNHTTTNGLRIALTYRMISILGLLYIFEYYAVSFQKLSKRVVCTMVLFFCFILMFMFSADKIPYLVVLYYITTIGYLLLMIYQCDLEMNLLNRTRVYMILLMVMALLHDLTIVIFNRGVEASYLIATIVITVVYIVKAHLKLKEIRVKIEENRLLKMKADRLELLHSESEKALSKIKGDLNSKFIKKQQYYEVLELVVDNLKTNVIVINQDFKIELAYGQAFGYEELGNQEIEKVFANVFQDDCQFFTSVLSKIFNAVDEVRETLFVSLLDSSLNINNKMYDMSYYVAHKNEKEKLLIMHAEVQAFDPKINQENHDQAVYNMITAVVRNTEMFFSDLASFNHYIKHQLTYLNEEETLEINIFKVLRKIHTFKGVFDQYNMITTVRAIDDIENELFNILHNNEILSLEQFKKLLIGYEMKHLIQTDLSILREHLGNEFFNYNKKIGVDLATLNRTYIKACNELGQSHELTQSINALKQVNVLEVLSSYENYVLRMADDLGKKVRYEVSGEAILVSRKQFIGLFEALIHILKNSVAHGIEYPDERSFLDKSPEASLTCHIHLDSDNLVLEIKDDGRGIDIKEIKNKLFIMGKYDIDDLDNIPDDEIYNMIIEDGVTSYAKPTDIAGRGVGMGSIRDVVTQIGGQIRVSSKPHNGVTYKINVPLIAKNEINIIEDDRILENFCLQAERLLTKSQKKSTLSSTWYIDESTLINNQLLDVTVYVKIKSNIDHHLFISLDEDLLYQLMQVYKIKHDNKHANIHWMNEAICRFAGEIASKTISDLEHETLPLKSEITLMSHGNCYDKFNHKDALSAELSTHEGRMRVFTLKSQLRLS